MCSRIFTVIGSFLICAVCSAQAADNQLEEIIISAHPLSGEGLSQPIVVLEGDELNRQLGANIGETLANQPGVHSSGFGKAVGRPVIHGLAGPRVKMMEDRIDTLDVSVTSADHAVGIDPFVLDGIEVLKGASTLLYGSGAIGGVVDMHSGRIPHRAPEGGFDGGIQMRYDTNTDGLASALKLNAGNDRFVFHVDLSKRDGDAYKIPGFAESSAQMAAEEDEEHDEDEHEEEEHEEEHDHEEEEVRGVLPGSEFDSQSWAFGVSALLDWGFAGIAVSRLESRYGLPGGHGHHEEEHEDEEHEDEEHDEEHEEEEGNPVLDLTQTRVDFELGVDSSFGVFDSFNLRAGFNDYSHDEIEPSGEVASTYTSEAWELRSELVSNGTDWRTVIGVQASDRTFSAVGEEAFVPGVDTDEQAIFALAERSFSTLELEFGARYGRVSHNPELGPKTDFDSWAASVGLIIPAGKNLTVSVLADVSARAPVGEELYSNGAHLATQSFELGDIRLEEEQANNIAATLNWAGSKFSASATLYHTRFEKFIYQQFTGAELDELPVLQYRQADAEFTGLDVEASVKLAEQWKLSLLFDTVNAELSDTGEHLPRIPAQRYGLGLGGQWDRLSLDVNWLHVEKQDDLSPGELPADEYDDLSASVYWDVHSDADSKLRLFLIGKNLTDEEQREHTSFIKDFAPRPGQSVELGLVLDF